MATLDNVQNVTVPGGEIWFNEFDDTGAPMGERYFGYTNGCTIKISSTTVEHPNTEGGAEVVDFSFVQKLERSGELSTEALTDENLRLFFLGTTSSVTQASGSVVDEVHEVRSGLTYQLGADVSNPTGVRGVSAVVVTNNAGTTTYATPADYTVDAVRGRLSIVPTGAIAAAAVGTGKTTIKVDYTKAANTRTQIATSSKTKISGAMRVIAKNAAGINRDFYFPSVTLAPDSDYVLKTAGGGKFSEMKFKLTVLQPASGEAIYIDGMAS